MSEVGQNKGVIMNSESTYDDFKGFVEENYSSVIPYDEVMDVLNLSASRVKAYRDRLNSEVEGKFTLVETLMDYSEELSKSDKTYKEIKAEDTKLVKILGDCLMSYDVTFDKIRELKPTEHQLERVIKEYFKEDIATGNQIIKEADEEGYDLYKVLYDYKYKIRTFFQTSTLSNIIRHSFLDNIGIRNRPKYFDIRLLLELCETNETKLRNVVLDYKYKGKTQRIRNKEEIQSGVTVTTRKNIISSVSKATERGVKNQGYYDKSLTEKRKFGTLYAIVRLSKDIMDLNSKLSELNKLEEVSIFDLINLSNELLFKQITLLQYERYAFETLTDVERMTEGGVILDKKNKRIEFVQPLEEIEGYIDSLILDRESEVTGSYKLVPTALIGIRDIVYENMTNK